jgi:hypothetical protein
LSHKQRAAEFSTPVMQDANTTVDRRSPAKNAAVEQK